MNFKLKHYSQIFMISLILLSVLSCSSWKVNMGFRYMGVYDDEIELSRLDFPDHNKEIYFLGLKHIGTPLFWKNMKETIDSLGNEGFHFYTEMIKKDTLQDEQNNYEDKVTVLFGLNKFDKKEDSLTLEEIVAKLIGAKKVKFKKEIKFQPSYKSLGVNKFENENVDITYKEYVEYYEKIAGEEVGLDRNYEINKEAKDSVVLGIRNANVVDHLKSDEHPKIVIIYGKGHLKGIQELWAGE